ncbi:hypothetical protein [Klebsiella quasipneumoniae]|uniref:hypothetical protein n=1 Tax=Klebsiella quasipneumoniae TaxID=1463165 RepID=UPI003EB810CA
MKGITTWIVLGSLLLSGCDQKSAHKEASSEPLSDISAALAFTCKHQIIPEASADTDVLFKYARWRQKII